MNQLDEATQVRQLFDRATADLDPCPVPLARVLRAGVRSRRAARARATALLVAAAAAALPVLGVLPAGPSLWDRLDGASSVAMPPSQVVVQGETVRFGAVDVSVPPGWHVVRTDDACARPMTVVVRERALPNQVPCGAGPSIVLVGMWDREWTDFAYPSGAGALTMLAGAPVWIDADASATGFLGTDGGRTIVNVPYGPVHVNLYGDATQRAALLRQVTPHRPASAPAFTMDGIDQVDLSTRDGFAMSVTGETGRTTTAPSDADGSPGTITINPDAAKGRALAAAVRASTPAASNRCVPAAKDQVGLRVDELATETEAEVPPELGTSFVTAVRGSCRLLYSSTGAVLTPSPGFAKAYLDALNTFSPADRRATIAMNGG